MLNTETPPQPAHYPERDRKMQRAAAYRSLVDSWAWKDLKLSILERIREQSIKDEDNVSVARLAEEIGVIAECRGRRQVIDKIFREIELILNPI